jgi:hypothetical protein
MGTARAQNNYCAKTIYWCEECLRRPDLPHLQLLLTNHNDADIQLAVPLHQIYAARSMESNIFATIRTAS